jgi:hypothetical protein
MLNQIRVFDNLSNFLNFTVPPVTKKAPGVCAGGFFLSIQSPPPLSPPPLSHDPESLDELSLLPES